MKKWLMVVLVGGVVVAAAVVMSARKPRPSGEPGKVPPAPDAPRAELMARPTGAGPYVAFHHEGAALPLTFEYPQNWKAGLEEGRAAPYRQVIILGPRNTLDTYSTSLVVRELRTRLEGGSYESAEALVERRRTQFAKADDFALLKDEPASVEGAKARELEFEYTARLPHPRSTPRLTTVKTRLVVAEHGGRLYELSYSADRQDYDRYRTVFGHLLDSVHFLP